LKSFQYFDSRLAENHFAISLPLFVSGFLPCPACRSFYVETATSNCRG
jgi:hypothetical protein